MSLPIQVGNAERAGLHSVSWTWTLGYHPSSFEWRIPPAADHDCHLESERERE
jgi:hypothetical protein